MNRVTTPTIAAENERVITRALRRLNQALCWHHFLISQRGEQLFVVCEKCGKETDGIRCRNRLSRRLR